MNSPATVRPPGRSRLALIVAGVLALLGSFAVTVPAQAGYYDDSNYGYNYGSSPGSYRSRCGYGYSPYRYARRYYNGCSSCGCSRRCGSRAIQALSTSVAMSNAHMSSGAMVMGATRRHYGYNPYGGYAVTTAIIRTGPIGGATEPIGAAMAMAVSGAAGPTATNRPPMDMKSRRGRQRRFGTGGRQLLSRSLCLRELKCRPIMATRSNIAGHLLLDMQVCRNRRRADRWRYWRPACSDISTSVPRSREYDVGGDREPEGVIADNLYLDEHAMTARITSTSETTNPKFTAHFSLRCDETPKPGLDWIVTGNVRDLSQAQRRRQRYVIRGLTSILLTRNPRAV